MLDDDSESLDLDDVLMKGLLSILMDLSRTEWNDQMAVDKYIKSGDDHDV